LEHGGLKRGPSGCGEEPYAPQIDWSKFTHGSGHQKPDLIPSTGTPRARATSFGSMRRPKGLSRRCLFFKPIRTCTVDTRF